MTRLMTFLFLVPPSALAAESRHSFVLFFFFPPLLSFYFADECEREDEIISRLFKRYIVTSVPCCPPAPEESCASQEKAKTRRYVASWRSSVLLKVCVSSVGAGRRPAGPNHLMQPTPCGYASLVQGIPYAPHTVNTPHRTPKLCLCPERTGGLCKQEQLFTH